MSGADAVLEAPSWTSVVLVCRDCRRRGNGPGKLKPKAVVSEVRRAVKEAKPRPRVVLTTCLGVCPKGAMTVGFAGAVGGTRVAAVETLADVDTAVALLLGPPPPA
jgi:hypothetical protein